MQTLGIITQLRLIPETPLGHQQDWQELRTALRKRFLPKLMDEKQTLYQPPTKLIQVLIYFINLSSNTRIVALLH